MSPCTETASPIIPFAVNRMTQPFLAFRHFQTICVLTVLNEYRYTKGE